MTTSFKNDQATGYVEADGFIGISAGAATFPDGLTVPSGQAMTAPVVSGIAKFVPATVAAAGASQGNATAMATTVVYVTATASAQGVKLVGSATLGSVFLVYAVHACKVYPPTSGKIDAVASNTAVSLVAAKAAIFAQITATQWVMLAGA